MKKRFVGISLAILIIIGIAAIFIINYRDREKTEDIGLETGVEFKVETLKNLLENSSYFSDSKIKANNEQGTVTIDKKYVITIKNSTYQMTIRDTKLESTYCKIVDVIENSLGAESGSTIDTCQKTLNGSINLGGINVEFFETYKLLTVNALEPSTLYLEENEKDETSVISTEENNYSVVIDDYIFTSILPNYLVDAKTLSICGNVYNPRKKANDTFNITLFDSNKNLLATKEYVYENTSKKYTSFCVEFDNVLSDQVNFQISMSEVNNK